MAFIVPTINDAIDYDDPALAGDALCIGETATMAPPVGWSIESGVRTSEPTRAGVASPRVSLAGHDITVSTPTVPFADDARALVKQVWPRPHIALKLCRISPQLTGNELDELRAEIRRARRKPTRRDKRLQQRS